MAHPIVTLRAYGDGLRLIIRPNLSITEIEEAIQQELARMNPPLSETSVQIDMRAPVLTDKELERLKTKLQKTYNLQTREVASPDETAAPVVVAAPATHTISQTLMLSHNESSEQSRIVPQTIRSGQTEDFPQGSLIIYGDVNQGAEVRAGGDIIVLGALRGSAHAGTNGRLSAVIIAMELVPLQLHIGNYINPPLLGQKSRGYPEIAYIGSKDMIVVERFVKF